MAARGLGRTLVIGNPVARGGGGESVALTVMRYFSSYHSALAECSVRLTEWPGDGERMAAAATDFDTVIALGGDGLVHEIACGLMRQPPETRPRLGVLPTGTGNDFARTLGLTRNDPRRAMRELIEGEEVLFDIGLVNDTYFCQTLSFGIDAAIALDANARRHNRPHQGGAGRFVTSGLSIIARNAHSWPYRIVADGDVYEGPALTLAIQNGPTYGGDFRICPDASPTDGMLDLCASLSAPLPAAQLAYFGLIRLGRHTHSQRLLLRQFTDLDVTFPEEVPPCQVDGERLEGSSFQVRVLPQALRVVRPRTTR
jgi:YegS/Rv2252/BmrU family lipid kinase